MRSTISKVSHYSITQIVLIQNVCLARKPILMIERNIRTRAYEPPSFLKVSILRCDDAFPKPRVMWFRDAFRDCGMREIFGLKNFRD